MEGLESDVVLGCTQPLRRRPARHVELRPREERAEPAARVQQQAQRVSQRREAARLRKPGAAARVVEEILAALGRRRRDDRPGDHPGQRRRDAVRSRRAPGRRIERRQPPLERLGLDRRQLVERQRDRLEQAERPGQRAREHAVQLRCERRAFRQPGVRRGGFVGVRGGDARGYGQRRQNCDARELHGFSSGSGATAGSPRDGSGGSSGSFDSTSFASFTSCAGSVHCEPPQVIDTTTPRSRTR